MTLSTPGLHFGRRPGPPAGLGVGLRFGRPAWTPADLPNVELWLRADDLAGADGSSVSSWEDRIAGYNFVQATGSKQPKLYTSTAARLIGGQPVVTFDGSDDILAYPTGIAPLSTPAGYVIVVYRMMSLPTGHEALFASANPGDDAKFVTHGVAPHTGTLRLDFNQRRTSAVGDGDACYGDDTVAVGTAYVNEYRSDSFDYEMRINGDSQTLTFVVGGDDGDWWADSVDLDNVSVGARKRSSEQNHAHADIAEVIAGGDAFSVGDTTSLYAYLEDRYGIAMP